MPLFTKDKKAKDENAKIANKENKKEPKNPDSKDKSMSPKMHKNSNSKQASIRAVTAPVQLPSPPPEHFYSPTKTGSDTNILNSNDDKKQSSKELIHNTDRPSAQALTKDDVSPPPSPTPRPSTGGNGKLPESSDTENESQKESAIESGELSEMDDTVEVKAALMALHDLKDDPLASSISAVDSDEPSEITTETNATATATVPATGAAVENNPDEIDRISNSLDSQAQDQGHNHGYGTETVGNSNPENQNVKVQVQTKVVKEDEVNTNVNVKNLPAPKAFNGTGTYKLDSAENVDEYLKNLGVGLVFRKVQSAANPTMTIFPCQGNEWAIKMDSIFRTREIKFRIGDEFVDETYDGRPCRSVASFDGPTRLVMRQRCPTGPDVRVVYEVQNTNSIFMFLTSGAHRAILMFSSITDL